VPIFGTEVWNDDGALYQITNATTINIVDAGRYRITLNLLLTNNGGNDLSPNGAILVNGAQVGTTSATGYISDEGGQDFSSLNFTEIIEVTANSTIQIRTEREAGAGGVFQAFLGLSNILIEKIN